MSKIFKTITTYPSGNKVKRDLTENRFNMMVKYTGYTQEPFNENLYIAEVPNGFNLLEILEVVETKKSNKFENILKDVCHLYSTDEISYHAFKMLSKEIEENISK